MKKVLFNTRYMGVLFFLFFASNVFAQISVPDREGTVWINAMGTEGCVYYLFEKENKFLITDEVGDTIVFSPVCQNFVNSHEAMSFEIRGKDVIVSKHYWHKKFLRRETHFENKYLFPHY